MTIPDKYQYAGRAISSYDWQDITLGQGYRRLYACASQISGADVQMFLTPATIAGQLWKQAEGLSSPTFAAYKQLQNYDFYVQFDIPTLVRGTIFMNIPISVSGAAGASVTGNTIVTLTHYDKISSATVIGSVATPLRTIVDSEVWYKECVRILNVDQLFRKGDWLKLNIKQGGYTNGSGELAFYLDPSGGRNYTDPFGRSFSTELIIHLPVKIDI